MLLGFHPLGEAGVHSICIEHKDDQEVDQHVHAHHHEVCAKVHVTNHEDHVHSHGVDPESKVPTAPVLKCNEPHPP